MPHNSGMSIYDEIRFLEGCSYNEKLRMWTRKKAAAAAASTKEHKRLEQQDIARLYGMGQSEIKGSPLSAAAKCAVGAGS